MKPHYRTLASVTLAGSLLGSAAAWTDLYTSALPATKEWRRSSLFNPPTLSLPNPPPEHVEATAYCGCPICCGKWSDGFTATGSPATEGFTLAADTNVFPFGTCLAIAGVGERVVEDTGSAIKGNKVDVYFESHEEAKAFGRKLLEVTPC